MATICELWRSMSSFSSLSISGTLAVWMSARHERRFCLVVHLAAPPEPLFWCVLLNGCSTLVFELRPMLGAQERRFCLADTWVPSLVELALFCPVKEEPGTTHCVDKSWLVILGTQDLLVCFLLASAIDSSLLHPVLFCPVREELLLMCADKSWVDMLGAQDLLAFLFLVSNWDSSLLHPTSFLFCPVRDELALLIDCPGKSWVEVLGGPDVFLWFALFAALVIWEVLRNLVIMRSTKYTAEMALTP